jgi:methyl-accepting chemotaxis protein
MIPEGKRDTNACYPIEPLGGVRVSEHEQMQRFQQLRDHAKQVQETARAMNEMANELGDVNHDSSKQAEQLQRLQSLAGTAADSAQGVYQTARHARSFQAQAHHATSSKGTRSPRH